MAPSSATDVLVVGAGPVGLIIALGLAQQGIDTVVIEKRSLQEQEKLGRACTLYPRTMELLDQLGVFGEMAQVAFIGRTYAAYSDGKRVTRKTWQSMFPMMDNSFHNYVVNIRQNNSQRIFAAKYRSDHNKHVSYGWELVDQKLESNLGDGYNVTAEILHAELGKRTVRCKYLVGADGGQSTVRQLAHIEMEGQETTYKWVRVDGRFKTDIPEPNLVFAALETPSHGNVLWAKLDHDAHRIGFALLPRLQAKYPNGISEEEARQEAMEAVRPFKLEIERLDWWTHYTVKQKIGQTLQKDDYVLLAGDAAHTHSSAYAQGMNTGVHDGTNLVWKLAGTLKGWYKKGILETYATERREAAQKLINIDKLAVQAVSGDVPEQYRLMGLSGQDAFRSIMETNMNFTIGLGVSYEPSILTRDPLAGTLVPGTRSPDALVRTPGPSVPVRLHSFIHQESKGRWNLLVFAGQPFQTRQNFAILRGQLSAPGSVLSSFPERLNLATIMVGVVGCAWDAFDGPAMGKLYFDTEAIAHSRYGIYEDSGGIVIVRPDGILAFAAGLGDAHAVDDFFREIFASQTE